MRCEALCYGVRSERIGKRSEFEPDAQCARRGERFAIVAGQLVRLCWVHARVNEDKVRPLALVGEVTPCR